MITKHERMINALKMEFGYGNQLAYREECERLEKALKRSKKVSKDLRRRINKAIDYLKNHVVATETEEILIKILQGEDF